MKDISQIVKSLEDSGLLSKGLSETIKDEAKEEKGEFVSMLLGKLGASLLENMFAGKGVIRPGEGTARVDYGSSFKKLSPHPLTNFERQMYYQNETRFNGVHSRSVKINVNTNEPVFLR